MEYYSSQDEQGIMMYHQCVCCDNNLDQITIYLGTQQPEPDMVVFMGVCCLCAEKYHNINNRVSYPNELIEQIKKMKIQKK